MGNACKSSFRDVEESNKRNRSEEIVENKIGQREETKIDIKLKLRRYDISEQKISFYFLDGYDMHTEGSATANITSKDRNEIIKISFEQAEFDQVVNNKITEFKGMKSFYQNDCTLIQMNHNETERYSGNNLIEKVTKFNYVYTGHDCNSIHCYFIIVQLKGKVDWSIQFDYRVYNSPLTQEHDDLVKAVIEGNIPTLLNI
ncbi:hypothetical protein ABK040_010836 [Willaertia magna]